MDAKSKLYKSKHKYPIDIDVFQQRLRALLNSNGMIMANLSEMTGLSKSTITRYLQGTTPDLIACCTLCDHFGVSVDWLLGRTAQKQIGISDEQHELSEKYMAASEADKAVIKLVLSKYDV